MSFNFDTLVKELLTEQVDLSTNILQAITDLFNSRFRNAPEYDLSQLAKIAGDLSKGGYGAVRNSTLNTMRPYWPYIDIFSFIGRNYLDNIDKLKDLSVLDKSIEDFLRTEKKITAAPDADVTGQPAEIQNMGRVLGDKIASLSVPDSYQYTADRIITLNRATNSIIITRFQDMSPVEAIRSITKEVGGYDVAKIDDILFYPVTYDLPTSIDLPELEPIRNISTGLLALYRAIYRKNLEAIKPFLPENIKNKTDKDIQNLVDKSAGVKSAENREIQQDYINFVNGKSKFIQQAVEEPPKPTGESFESLINSILTEVTLPSQPGTPTSKPMGQTTRPEAPSAQQSASTSTEPFIKNIKDLGDTTVPEAQMVYEILLNYFNSIKKGTRPSAGQVLKQVGTDLFQGALGIADELSKL